MSGNKKKKGKARDFIPFVKAGEVNSSEAEENIPETASERYLNPVRVPEGEIYRLQSKEKRTNYNKISKKSVPESHQLYVAFRGKEVPETSQIKELDPDVISIQFARRGRFAILTFPNEEAANHGYYVLSASKINGCFLRVSRAMKTNKNTGPLELVTKSCNVKARVQKIKNRLRRGRKRKERKLSEPLQKMTISPDHRTGKPDTEN